MKRYFWMGMVLLLGSCGAPSIEGAIVGRWRAFEIYVPDDPASEGNQAAITEGIELEFREDGCFSYSRDSNSYLGCLRWEFFESDSVIQCRGITAAGDTIVRSMVVVAVNSETLEVRSPRNFHDKEVHRFKRIGIESK